MAWAKVEVDNFGHRRDTLRRGHRGFARARAPANQGIVGNGATLIAAGSNLGDSASNASSHRSGASNRGGITELALVIGTPTKQRFTLAQRTSMFVTGCNRSYPPGTSHLHRRVDDLWTNCNLYPAIVTPAK